MSIKIVYYSMTGNTEQMAQAIADGVTSAGGEAELIKFEEASSSTFEGEDKFALGCPAMGDEVLEEGSVEPLFSEIESSLSGKTVLLFGSYGWGDGKWMRDWEERVTSNGGTLLGGEGIIANSTPDEEAIAKLNEAGKALAA